MHASPPQPVPRLSLLPGLLPSLSLAFSAACCPHASAAEDESVRPYVSLLVAHDDNLYHLNSAELGRRLLGSSNLSDSYRRLAAGVLIDKQFSQQRLTLDLNLNRTTFERFSNLDNDGKDLSLKLNWHWGSRVEGNIGSNLVTTLTPFSTFQTTERNLRTQKRLFADAAWRFHPSWRLRGGITSDRLNYDLAAQRANDRDISAQELGLDYLSAGSSTIGLQLGHSSGNYRFAELIGPFQVANNYSQHEVKGKIDWLASGKTRLQFLGGWVERKHDAFSVRDFSGANARLIATLQATGKIAVTANLWREIGSVDELTASYTLNQGISVNSNWDLTSKIRLEAQARTEKRGYAGTPALPILLVPMREDTYRNLSLSATYLPIRNWQIALTAFRDQQSSNVTTNSYRSSGLLLNTRFDF